MALSKAIIRNEDTKEELKICFNPREYTFTKVAPWAEHNINGLDAPKYEWTSGQAMLLNVELFFDAYELEGAERDVRTKWTDTLETFQLVNPDKHRPPILLFNWGKKLNFKCLLKNLSIRFVMFLDDGTPVRAVASCLFTEFTPPESEALVVMKESVEGAHEFLRVASDWSEGKLK